MDKFAKSLLPENWKKDDVKMRSISELFKEMIGLFKDIREIFSNQEKRIKTLEDNYSRALKREIKLLDLLTGKEDDK